MKILKYILPLLAIVASVGCENDIEINAPWREIPVVYAFLDASTNTQYFRIQRAYQNSPELTTQQGAQIVDSLYFDTLIVTITTDDSVYQFEKTTEIPKQTGYFSSGVHYLYKSTFTPIANKRYSLNIFSPKTGNTYTASSNAIGSSNVSESTTRFTNANSRLNVTTTTSAGSFANNAFMVLRYEEFPIGNPGAAVVKTIPYSIIEAPVNGSLPGTVRYSVLSNTFINFVRASIQENAALERRILGLDFVNIGSGKEILDLIQVSNPSAAIVQKSIEYSNISGGLGIFSSRCERYTQNIQAITASNLDAWNNTNSSPTGNIEPQKELLRKAINNPTSRNFIP